MEVSVAVLVWWASLSAISVVNIALWIALLRKRVAPRLHLVLSGVYVFVCAFRSFVPRADVQRICFVDSFWASIFVGRTVATVAEICFMVQLVVTARLLARELSPKLLLLVTLPLPMILVAETCSWYAVLTTNYAGNFIEESLWMLSGLIFGISLVVMRRNATGRLQQLLSIGAVLSLIYFTFMLLVDVRMYFTRLGSDLAEHRSYLTVGEGLRDAIHRRVVTFAWTDWHEELAWMFLYFSVTVWFSLYLARSAPSFTKRQPSLD